MDTSVSDDNDPNKILANDIFKRFDRLRKQGVSEKDVLVIINSSAYEAGHTDGHEAGYESGYNTGFQTGRILLQNEIARAQEQYAGMFYRERGEHGNQTSQQEEDEGMGQYL
ncbi:MAG: hypothetical protein WDZ40_04070 [Candidatus Spechtbacterales bacterium]